MYLHIGGGTVIREEDIVGVFDLDNTSTSHLTRQYLSAAEKGGQVINAAEDIPKSFIVCSDGDKRRVYLSQMSTQTLLARVRNELRALRFEL